MFAVFDIETTGTDPAIDRIVQVGIVQVDQDLHVETEWQSLINPGCAIPTASSAVHKINDSHVAAAPPFRALASEVLGRLKGRTIVGFGCLRFDVPCLAEEFDRAGIDWVPERVIDVGAIFMELNPRTLTAALKHYTGAELTGAHDALADARATLQVFERQWLGDLTGKSVEDLEALGRRGKSYADACGKLLLIDGVMCFGTKRNEGVPVADDLGYARWMLRSGFPSSTKRVLLAEVNRIEKAVATPGKQDHPTLW